MCLECEPCCFTSPLYTEILALAYKQKRHQHHNIGVYGDALLMRLAALSKHACVPSCHLTFMPALIDRKAVDCYRKVGGELGRHAVKDIRFDLNLVQWSEDSSSCTWGTHSKRLKPFCLIQMCCILTGDVRHFSSNWQINYQVRSITYVVASLCHLG